MMNDSDKTVSINNKNVRKLVDQKILINAATMGNSAISPKMQSAYYRTNLS